jgi:EAL domain-containing protein (putative c-di-GMP-specific phosphodiesterase class I)
VAGDFVLHYQPLVDLAHGEMVGVEALVRWRQPNGELAAPSEFIPLAEETGLMLPLGQWVLDEACRQAGLWRVMAGARPLSMAVNVASRQLQAPGFAAGVAAALARSALQASSLVLELTESALLDEGETTSASIAEVKQLGVKLALDDFGTGYSSLSHLRRFPIDILKIDRSFVEGIDTEEHGERSLVRSIINLARSLNLETVAEGVERPEQALRLRALGAGLAQGFYFARPMDADALTDVLRRGSLMVS